MERSSVSASAWRRRREGRTCIGAEPITHSFVANDRRFLFSAGVGLDASVVTSAVVGGLLYVMLVVVRPHAHAPRRAPIAPAAETVALDGGVA